MYGYNPGFSNTITGIQSGLACLNGLVDGFNAANNGANIGEAITYGLGSAAVGVGNAALGNVIDKSTHSYIGTTMNSVMTTFTGGNNYATTFGLAGAAMFTPAPMLMPFGFSSAWTSPFMFGSPMPMFGGFCFRC